VKQVIALAIARTGALTTGIGHAQAFVKSRGKLPAPNLQLAFSAFAFDVTEKGNLELRKESSVSTFVALMRPQSRGRITLRSADPDAPPKIEHLLLGDEDDVAQLVDGLEIARKIMTEPAIAAHVKGEVRPGAELTTREQLGFYVRAATIPMFHPVGTAKMGRADDPQAVVGADCRVRGVDGLWVADASIMPTIPQGNTNATAIMIGERASDLILGAPRGKMAAYPFSPPASGRGIAPYFDTSFASISGVGGAVSLGLEPLCFAVAGSGAPLATPKPTFSPANSS
jgi:choline dehydrogenase